MAQIFPTIENIERLKEKPTDGEWFLLNYLVDNLDDEFEIYFQSFLGISRPDIIIMKKGCGVAVIEVKDWIPGKYFIDEKNTWRLSSNRQPIKSPYQQVFAYKKSMFGLYISGLLDNQIKNQNFWKIVTPYVYFHNYSKDDINNLFMPVERRLSELRDKTNQWYKNLTQDARINSKSKYEKDLEYLNTKKAQFTRDKSTVGITSESLSKITNNFYFVKGNSLFDLPTYYEFRRVLQPPYHLLEQGKKITYTDKQLLFSESKDEHAKVKGVAGSGKTLTLAKRAVNAYKRHDDHVLILTYNLTLRSYVHDRISDVREGFHWGYFHITNYHQLMMETLNIHGKKVKVPDGIKAEDYFDKLLSDINLFDDIDKDIYKFKTILIDEIQDYSPEWIKILRKYFIEDDAEMVLFGDEKQNIYERELEKDNTSRTPNGFGSWKMLNKPIRHKQYSYILELVKNFQQEFLSKKYDIDKYEEGDKGDEQQLLGWEAPKLGGKIFTYSDGDIAKIISVIFNNVKKDNLHSDDFAIICSRIETIREIDHLVRNKYNQETITTFISKELKETLYLDLNALYSDDDVNRNRKVQFQHHSGAIKLSTTHSYKGFESPTIFLILSKHDHDEMVYTGITRAISNIVIFIHKDSKYKEFFSSHLQPDELI
jgi:hypothetical protein